MPNIQSQAKWPGWKTIVTCKLSLVTLPAGKGTFYLSFSPSAKFRQAKVEQQNRTEGGSLIEATLQNKRQNGTCKWNIFTLDIWIGTCSDREREREREGVNVIRVTLFTSFGQLDLLKYKKVNVKSPLLPFVSQTKEKKRKRYKWTTNLRGNSTVNVHALFRRSSERERERERDKWLNVILEDKKNDSNKAASVFLTGKPSNWLNNWTFK